MSKKLQKWQKMPILAKSAIFIKKMPTSFSSPYGALTSYQVSEKSLVVFEKSCYKRADKPDSIGPSGFKPGTNKGQYVTSNGFWN